MSTPSSSFAAPTVADQWETLATWFRNYPLSAPQPQPHIPDDLPATLIADVFAAFTAGQTSIAQPSVISPPIPTTGTSQTAFMCWKYFVQGQQWALSLRGPSPKAPSADLRDVEMTDSLPYILRHEKRVIEKAFDLPFRDPDKLEERFIRFICSCAEKYQVGSEFYAPYTTLIQASGTGKSRLLYKIAESVKSVYCCLREKSSSGYPPRSYIANKLLEDSRDANSVCATYLSYIVACVERLQKFRGSPGEWLRSHTSTSMQQGFWKDIESRMLELKTSLLQRERENWTEFVKNMISVGTAARSFLEILFIFDEARYLTTETTYDGRTHFYHLRHALQYLPDKFGIFAVFTDTNSRVSNFSPTPRLDPSQRISEGGHELFPPFYLLDTIDIYTKDAGIEPRTPSDAENLGCIFRWGRPLWGSLLEAQHSVPTQHSEASKQIISLAMDKILGGTNFTSWKKNKRTFTAVETLSILGPRLCIDVSPWSSLSSQLVSNHMWLCLHVSEQRDRITTSLPSEPILAEAAARIMNDSSIDISELLNVLASTFKEGVVLGGYRGELVARFLLLRAWDTACNKRIRLIAHTTDNKYSLSMTLKEFLESLLAPEAYGKLLEQSKPLLYNALIRFTHFIKVTYTPNRLELLQFFIRGAAVLCKDYEKGADIIIPIFMGKVDTSLDADRISYILIQVKNLQNDASDDAYPASATSALSPARIGIEDLPHMPFLSIYMQLRSPSNCYKIPRSNANSLRPSNEDTHLKRTTDGMGDEYLTRSEFLKKTRLNPSSELATSSEISAFRNHFQVALSLFGLSPDVYRCLGSEGDRLTIALEKLLVTSMDILIGSADEETKWRIMRMLPLQYRLHN